MKLFELLEGGEGAPDADEALEVLMELAQAAENLDGWITGGGFLPEAWNEQNS